RGGRARAVSPSGGGVGGRQRHPPRCRRSANRASAPNASTTRTSGGWTTTPARSGSTSPTRARRTASCPAARAASGGRRPRSAAEARGVCETQQLKLYLGADPGGVGLVDLFLDPDERGRHIGEDDPLFAQMSSPGGPYGPDLRRLSCCIDA